MIRGHARCVVVFPKTPFFTLPFLRLAVAQVPNDLLPNLPPTLIQKIMITVPNLHAYAPPCEPVKTTGTGDVTVLRSLQDTHLRERGEGGLMEVNKC